MRRKELPVKYNFSFDDETLKYGIVFSFSLPRKEFVDILKGATKEEVQLKDGKMEINDAKICNAFYKNFAKKRIKKVMRDANNILKGKGIKDLSFITAKVDKIAVETNQDKIDVNVHVSGDCIFRK